MNTSSSKESAEHAKEHLRSAINHAEEGGRRAKRDAVHAVNDAHDGLSSMAHEAGAHLRDKVRSFVRTAGDGLEQAKDGYEYAKDSISDASETVAKKIRRNPLPATAIAMGVGVLIGAFLRRRSS